MHDDLPQRHASAADAVRLALAGQLNRAGLERAYALVGQTPGPVAWARFVSRSLLALGVILALAGAIFLVAYNWADMPRLLKLGLVQAVLLALVALAAWRGLATLAGRAALLGAAVLVGALFAVFGQVYQTGADSFQLFLSWALLIVPWVAIARWTPLWLLLLLLLNLAGGFFWQQRLTYDFSTLAIALALLNVAWLCAWEYGVERGIAWMDGGWFPQLISTVVFGLLLVPTVEWIVDPSARSNAVNLLGTGLYAAFCLLVVIYYRQRRELLPMSVCALSLVIAVTAGGVRLLDHVPGSNGLLLLSLIVVGATSLAVALLRHTARSWERTIA